MTTPEGAVWSVEIEGLTKSYPLGLLRRRRHLAVDALDLRVQQGEVFGCLGPNGSGKTTTLKAVLGLVTADAGRVSILGRPHSDRSWRERVGYLPENPYFYDYLTAGEYLDYVGRLHALPADVRRRRSAELLESMGLSRSGGVALRRFSKGMVQRVGLAQALIHDPELLFLDEPMSGLDPVGRRLVRDVIRNLKKAGKTVFFSTHILSDAEALCDRVALLRRGRLVRVGRLDEILEIDVAHMEVLATGLTGETLAALAPACRVREVVGERHRLEVDEGALGQVLGRLVEGRARILSVQPVRQSLEELFFKEMGSNEGGQWMADD